MSVPKFPTSLQRKTLNQSRNHTSCIETSCWLRGISIASVLVGWALSKCQCFTSAMTFVPCLLDSDSWFHPAFTTAPSIFGMPVFCQRSSILCLETFTALMLLRGLQLDKPESARQIESSCTYMHKLYVYIYICIFTPNKRVNRGTTILKKIHIGHKTCQWRCAATLKSALLVDIVKTSLLVCSHTR